MENDYESVKEALVDMSEDTSAHIDIGSDTSFSLKKTKTLSHRKATAAVAKADHCPPGAVHQRFCVMTRWAEHHGTRRCDSEDAHRAAQVGSTAAPCTIRTNILCPRSRRGGDRAIASSGRSYPANPWRTSRSTHLLHDCKRWKRTSRTSQNTHARRARKENLTTTHCQLMIH